MRWKDALSSELGTTVFHQVVLNLCGRCSNHELEPNELFQSTVAFLGLSLSNSRKLMVRYWVQLVYAEGNTQQLKRERIPVEEFGGDNVADREVGFDDHLHGVRIVGWVFGLEFIVLQYRGQCRRSSLPTRPYGEGAWSA